MDSVKKKGRFVESRNNKIRRAGNSKISKEAYARSASAKYRKSVKVEVFRSTIKMAI